MANDSEAQQQLDAPNRASPKPRKQASFPIARTVAVNDPAGDDPISHMGDDAAALPWHSGGAHGGPPG